VQAVLRAECGIDLLGFWSLMATASRRRLDELRLVINQLRQEPQEQQVPPASDDSSSTAEDSVALQSIESASPANDSSRLSFAAAVAVMGLAKARTALRALEKQGWIRQHWQASCETDDEGCTRDSTIASETKEQTTANVSMAVDQLKQIDTSVLGLIDAALASFEASSYQSALHW